MSGRKPGGYQKKKIAILNLANQHFVSDNLKFTCKLRVISHQEFLSVNFFFKRCVEYEYGMSYGFFYSIFKTYHFEERGFGILFLPLRGVEARM